MAPNLQLDKLTREEKLRMMDALWEDLSSDPAAVESPAWHEGALRETAARASADQESPMDWNNAKKELRKRVE